MAKWVGPPSEILDDSPWFHFHRQERRHKAPSALVAGGDGGEAAGFGPVAGPWVGRADGALASRVGHGVVRLKAVGNGARKRDAQLRRGPRVGQGERLQVE